MVLTRSFEGGSSITGAFTGRRSIRRCGNWIDHWPAGLIGTTRSCAGICVGGRMGLRGSRDAIRSCGRTGKWVGGVAPGWEPCERRRSSRVRREPWGAIPRGYSPRDPESRLRGGGTELDAAGGDAHGGHPERRRRPGSSKCARRALTFWVTRSGRTAAGSASRMKWCSASCESCGYAECSWALFVSLP